MNRTFSTLVTGACPIALVLLAGCSHTTPAPKLAVYEPAPVVVAQAPAPRPAAAPQPVSMVHVSPDILAACGIHDANDDAIAGGAPHFAFDSSRLSKDDQRLLQEVAACTTTGPLAGRALSLVGRCDPRGSEDYNMQLGDRRASSVERYLERHGVEADKLHESSRGKLDATGTDESGWQRDRRVDVSLSS